MGQKANCCYSKNKINEEKESEIFTDSNHNNMVNIPQNKNELTDISGKINNNKIRIRQK